MRDLIGRKWRQYWKLAHCLDNEIVCSSHLSRTLYQSRHNMFLFTKRVYHKKWMIWWLKTRSPASFEAREDLWEPARIMISQDRVGKIGSHRGKYAFGGRDVLHLAHTVWCIVATSRMSIGSCAIQECTPGLKPGNRESMMEFTDRILYCRDCNQEFTFTTGEQEFFESRGLTNAPSRCPTCRAARKQAGGGHANRGQGTGYHGLADEPAASHCLPPHSCSDLASMRWMVERTSLRLCSLSS